jgi:hypothetical protein
MPSITKDSAVQDVSVKTVTFSFGDLNEDTVYDVMDLPPNSVILSGSFFTTVAWNSTTSDVIDIGDSASATRYCPTATFAPPMPWFRWSRPALFILAARCKSRGRPARQTRRRPERHASLFSMWSSARQTQASSTKPQTTKPAGVLIPLLF